MSPLMLTIEPTMIIIFWACCPIVLEHKSYWYPYVERHLTTYYLEYTCLFKRSDRSRRIHLTILITGSNLNFVSSSSLRGSRMISVEFQKQSGDVKVVRAQFFHMYIYTHILYLFLGNWSHRTLKCVDVLKHRVRSHCKTRLFDGHSWLQTFVIHSSTILKDVLHQKSMCARVTVPSGTWAQQSLFSLLLLPQILITPLRP